jgi:hypothetical protein
MKLAEALALRADLQTQLLELGKRLQQNARYQEGEEPAEDADAPLAQVDRITGDLETLIVQINVRNLATEVEPGFSMTAALARRDVLKIRHRQRTQLAESASTPVDRYSRTELRSIAAVNVRALRTEIDDLARRIRELDTRIQGVNWTVEL